MRSQKVFWTSILLLAVLALGGCAQVATQQKVASPAAQEVTSAPQEEREERRE
jgi:hypothetical protein